MSYFPVDSPYYQKIIQERQLLWIISSKEEGGLGEEGIPQNLLLPYINEENLLYLLKKISRKSFVDLNSALKHFYTFKRNSLNIILKSQIPQTNISSMKELVQKISCDKKPPCAPIILDFPQQGKYSFPYFTAKSDNLFIYTLSHLLQDQIDKIIERAEKIKNNNTNNFYDYDINRIVPSEQIHCRYLINGQYKFVCDNPFIHEVLKLYLQYPEVLVKFDDYSPSVDETISSLSFKIKYKKSFLKQVWCKFFSQRGIISFSGKCYTCGRHISYDNWNICSINKEEGISLENVFPVCSNCCLIIKENISSYIITNDLYHSLAARYLKLVSPVGSQSLHSQRITEGSYHSNIGYLTGRTGYSATRPANLSYVPSFRY